MHIPIYIVSAAKDTENFVMPSEDDIYGAFGEEIDYVDLDNTWKLSQEFLPDYLLVTDVMPSGALKVRVNKHIYIKKISKIFDKNMPTNAKEFLSAEDRATIMEGIAKMYVNYVDLVYYNGKPTNGFSLAEQVISNSQDNEFIVHAICDAHI